jgi:hypothetical protein
VDVSWFAKLAMIALGIVWLVGAIPTGHGQAVALGSDIVVSGSGCC